MSFKTAETYSRVIGETGMKCLCGLDHSKPFPEVFEWPPIVMAFLEGYPVRSNCHVCHVESLNSEFETFDDFPHADDCAYHKYRIKEQLREIVDKLSYPEKHAKDYSTWYSGDGPFEEYCNKLQDEARGILEKYDKIKSSEDKMSTESKPEETTLIWATYESLYHWKCLCGEGVDTRTPLNWIDTILKCPVCKREYQHTSGGKSLWELIQNKEEKSE